MTLRACDTSVLVPALVPWHPDHVATKNALTGVGVVPAHVLIEAFSVLTRLPAPHRVAPADAAAVLQALPLKLVTLPAAKYAALIPHFGDQGIRGGAVYDAVVAATARHHGATLVTRDRRARATYDLVGVTYGLV